MAGPWKHPSGIYWYRKALPTDLKRRFDELHANGINATKEVQRSLGTRDLVEARRKYADVDAEVSAMWSLWRGVLDEEPAALAHKQVVAISGAAALEVVQQYEDNPQDFPPLPASVLEYLEMMSRVFPLPPGYKRDPLHDLVAELRVVPAVGLMDYVKAKKRRGEPRLKGYLDAVLLVLEASAGELAGAKAEALLLRHGVRPDRESLERIRKQADGFGKKALGALAARLEGDYGPPKWADNLPPIEASSPTRAAPRQRNLWEAKTFEDIIATQAAREVKGLRAPSAATLRKYRGVAKEFITWRGGDSRVFSITEDEAARWRDDLIDTSDNASRTVRHKIATLKTITKWGQHQSKSDSKVHLFPAGLPLKDVELPEFIEPDSASRTYTIEEAQKVLKAARGQNVAYIRWAPWILAYSGMRLGEALQLDAEDLFPVDGGGHLILVQHDGINRRTKTKRPRWVPLHPALEREGLVEFIESVGNGPLFEGKRMDGYVREWIHRQFEGELGKPPAHAFRHLFEDLMRAADLPEDLQRYVTGRAKRGSGGGYGYGLSWRPEAVRQMARIRRIL